MRAELRCRRAVAKWVAAGYIGDQIDGFLEFLTLLLQGQAFEPAVRVTVMSNLVSRRVDVFYQFPVPLDNHAGNEKSAPQTVLRQKVENSRGPWESATGRFQFFGSRDVQRSSASKSKVRRTGKPEDLSDFTEDFLLRGFCGKRDRIGEHPSVTKALRCNRDTQASLRSKSLVWRIAGPLPPLLPRRVRR